MDLINCGIANYGPGRFAAQNNDLTNTTISATIVNVAALIGTGYQEEDPLGTGFAAAASLAIDADAKFLEIYGSDLTNTSNQAAITAVHNELLAN